MHRTGIPMVLLVLLVRIVPAIGQDSGGPAQSDEGCAEERIATLEHQVGQLQDKLEALVEDRAQQQQTPEQEALRQALQEQLARNEDAPDTTDSQPHTSGSLSLQQLNPEISVTGDMLFSWQQGSPDPQTTDFTFRGLGIHVQSWLDPYTRFKAAVPVTENGAELGEAYIELHQISDDLILTIGKFRQQLGVVNRWHKHGLDQVDFPLALRQIFGPAGLNQVGLSLDCLMPSWGSASQKFTFQVTDAENSRLFSGNTDNRPALLGRYSQYRDLSKDTYYEAGLSGLLGWNDSWPMVGGGDQKNRKETAVIAADFTMLWEPTDKMRYRNVEWRSEAYWLHRNYVAPDGSGVDSLDAWGLYSYVQAKVARTLDVGLRGDLFIPDTKAHAHVSDSLTLSPLAVTASNAYLYQFSPYATWWQSPFVKFRTEYDYSDGCGLSFARHAVWLQAVFAAGPHKHERY
jgi:hypothetical protein